MKRPADGIGIKRGATGRFPELRAHETIDVLSKSEVHAVENKGLGITSGEPLKRLSAEKPPGSQGSGSVGQMSLPSRPAEYQND
jgi:hypothetical protein